MESSSALSRWKSQNAMSVAKPNTVNGFIIATKLRKVISREYSEASHIEFGRVTRAGVKAEHGDALNRLISRIDCLPTAVLKGLYDAYDKTGLRAVVVLLNTPKAELIGKFGSW